MRLYASPSSSTGTPSAILPWPAARRQRAPSGGAKTNLSIGRCPPRCPPRPPLGPSDEVSGHRGALVPRGFGTSMADDLNSPKSVLDSSCLRHVRVLPFYVAVLSWIIIPFCLIFVLNGDAILGTTVLPPSKAGHSTGRSGSHRVHDHFRRPSTIPAAAPAAVPAPAGEHAQHTACAGWLPQGMMPTVLRV